MPHLATVEDVANAILFLASDQSAAISGSNVLIDGATMTGIGGESLITIYDTRYNKEIKLRGIPSRYLLKVKK